MKERAVVQEGGATDGTRVTGSGRAKRATVTGRTTIVQIAKALSLAPSTVSRALNDPRRLRPETVERVRIKAAELGYVPNEHARALISGRAGALGFIVPDITNPFFPPMVRAAQRASEQRGLGVFIADTGGDTNREMAMADRLIPRVEGLVLASSRLSDAELRSVAHQTPTILINRDLPGFSRVMISSGVAIAQAIDDFYQAGHRRLVYVGGPAASWSEHERCRAVVDRSKEYGITYSCLRAPDGVYEQARDLVDDIIAARPTAIVAFDDVLAYGVLDGLAVRGVSIPDDVVLLGCDDALPIVAGKRMSTISLPTAHAATEAVRLLTDPDPPSETTPTRLELHGTLQYRGTTT